MFVTQDRNQLLGIPDERFGGGERWWTAVRHYLAVPWFHAEVTAEPEPGIYLGEAFFLTELEQAIQLQEQPDVELTGISLVSPPRLNGADGWRMDPLAEVWETQGASNSTRIETVYLLRDGRMLRDSHGGPGDGHYTGHELIFQFQESTAGD